MGKDWEGICAVKNQQTLHPYAFLTHEKHRRH